MTGISTIGICNNFSACQPCIGSRSTSVSYTHLDVYKRQAEQAAWAWFKSEFLYPKKLVFKSDSLYFDAMKDAIAQGEKPPRKRKTTNPSHQLGKNSNLFIFRTERKDAYNKNAQ